jgi:Rps23 Pro-64 3,4-dihydroxylase Tpa1-like proline 4-hydroxylase
MIGWADTYDVNNANRQYLHSTYSEADLEQTLFLQHITDPVLLEKIKGRKPAKIIVNLSVPGDVNFSHTHHNQDVLLYYVNTQWKEEWAGETMFFDATRTNVVFCSTYTPNRAVFFDGEILHSLRPQSVIAPHYRTTLSIFFNKD